MDMNAVRTVLAIALLGLSGFAGAQTDGERSSIPPGSAQDGSRPSDGAIKGGAILPGESGGMPDGAPRASPPADRAASRCYELSGTLREQCLRDARNAGAGATRPSEAPPTVRDPINAPPPQNPR
ncbi:MAG: hypothetical protein ACT4P3_09610 [Betaproteobacteria bacterium]